MPVLRRFQCHHEYPAPVVSVDVQAQQQTVRVVGFLRKGREDGLRDLERKALQVGTDEDGGYAVPEALDRNILTLLKDEVVMRQEATVITVGGSDYKKLVNLGGTASGWVGETDARSQTATSKLGLIEPFMGEIYGNPQATQKMLDDAFFNVEAWINSELATEFAEQEEIAFTTGDGTKKPKGFLAYESTNETDKVRAFGKLQHIVSGDATAVTADAIIKLIYTLRKAHRTGAKFMMNNNSLFAIRLLKDTEGNYLWRPGLELGQPSSLAGYGIAENEQMPDTRFGPGQAIVTPAVIKGELLATYRQLERAGIVENYELFKQYLVVERDASDPNRLNTLFPPDYVNQLRVFAVVNQFRLQYSEESA